MLKKILQRIAFGRTSWDPVAYWRARAADPETMSVMWQNLVYNEMVDRDEWDVIERYLPDRREAALDLGCGTGRLSARLAERFDAYTGVDLDTMVAEAVRRNPGLAGGYVAATVESYDYPTDRFDFVLSLGCLATACSKEALPGVARRIVGSLRSRGRLVLIEPFHESSLLTRGCRTTPREVARLFESMGMRLDARDGMLFFPARMTLSEPAFGRFPRLTTMAYRAGERAVRLAPSLLSDYAIIVLTKRG
ncbi:MAG: class I SAM-dependent methyltransferase [Labilithrix sp.]|nr:class I SAM-dependent methyltransferase [Labilithrix sp.]